jgi:hypothetical protein
LGIIDLLSQCVLFLEKKMLSGPAAVVLRWVVLFRWAVQWQLLLLLFDVGLVFRAATA